MADFLGGCWSDEAEHQPLVCGVGGTHGIGLPSGPKIGVPTLVYNTPEPARHTLFAGSNFPGVLKLPTQDANSKNRRRILLVIRASMDIGKIATTEV